MKKTSGFTFLEIIMTIATLGILAAVAIPKFFGFQEEARQAAEEQVVAGVRSGISTYFIGSLTSGRSPLYPEKLDEAANSFASGGNPFFTYILASPGLIDKSWRKLSDSIYQGPGITFYFYDPATGNFQNRIVLTSDILSLLGMPPAAITAGLISQMGSENIITFPDGKKLIGGSTVLVPRAGTEPRLEGAYNFTETFSNLQGNIQAEITGEYAGYAMQNRFGYYTIDPVTGAKTLHQIFAGPDTLGAVRNFTVNPGETVGFYFSTPQGHTYYTQKNSNPDKVEHLRVYQNDSLRKITVGCEDLIGGGDRDFQDMIITISY